MQLRNLSYFKRIVIFMTVSALFGMIVAIVVFKGSDTVDVYLDNLNGSAYKKVMLKIDKAIKNTKNAKYLIN